VTLTRVSRNLRKLIGLIAFNFKIINYKRLLDLLDL
jgi:hypothetical protein